jgi:hypothetical protein
MGDVVPTSLLEDREFLADCCRYSENLISEKQIKKKYRFNTETWDRLAADEALIEAIELEKIRRIRNGTTAREKAQTHFATAPDILNTIMQDGTASPRHKIESAKTLGQIAAGPEATAPAPAERFIIQINMGNGEVVRYDQPKTIDNRPTTEDAADQLNMELIPFVVAKKNGGDGGNFL